MFVRGKAVSGAFILKKNAMGVNARDTVDMAKKLKKADDR
jgi:hypothetical protein